MSVADVDGSIEKTSEAVAKVIDKPQMKPKLLERPPFRFLHDVVTGIIKATGWQADLYTDAEKDNKSEIFNEKAGKCAYFEKIIGVVSAQLGISITADPGKIVSGKDCEDTRKLLHYIALAASGVKGGGGGEAKEDEAKQPAAESKQESKEEAEEEPPAPAPAPKAETKESKRDDGPSGGGGGGGIDGDLTKTMDMVGAVIKKPPMKEKLLERPPFRFVHDVVTNVMAATNYRPDLFTSDEMDSKSEFMADKDNKLAYLEKIVKATSDDLGISKDYVNSKAVLGGKEPEKTRMFLCYLVLAAKGEKAPGGSSSSSSSSKSESKQPEPAPAPAESKDDDAPAPAPAPAPSPVGGNSGGNQYPEVDGTVETTAKAVSAVVSKPPMKDKLLQKPPFRFLHDCITAVLSATGYPEGLLEESEKDAKSFEDKDSKVRTS
jgi:hypothetical protein